MGLFRCRRTPGACLADCIAIRYTVLGRGEMFQKQVRKQCDCNPYILGTMRFAP